MAKFTFKTEKPTGTYSSFFPSNHYIKLNKKIVGQIVGRELGQEWKIKLMIYKDSIHNDNNPNCKWMWITLFKSFSSLQESKQFLNDNFDGIIEKYNLYSVE